MGSPQGRKGVTTQLSSTQILASIVTVLIGAVIIAGLYVAGSPGKERGRRFDQERISHLQQIAWVADTYYASNNKLPATIEEIYGLSGRGEYYVNSITDPETKAPYGYTPMDAGTYEVCAVFASFSQEPLDGSRYPTKPMAAPPVAVPGDGYKLRDWSYSPGPKCFRLDANDVPPRVTCSLTNPCQSGQVCAQLPEKKGTVCVPEGKECLAAGCPSESCAILESYPVQVTCAPPTEGSGSCTLMRERATGDVDCFGCTGRVCKDPGPGWEEFAAPNKAGSVGIPYACYQTPEGCALAQ